MALGMRCSQSLSDAQLVAAAQAGDSAAMGRLLRRHEQRLRAAAIRLASPDGDAEEVLQDTLLQVVRTLHQFRGESSFLTWASAVARSQAHRQRRGRARERARRDAVSAVMHGAPTYMGCRGWDPEQETSDAQLRARIRAALDALNPLDRRVFAMRQLQGRSAPDVAQALGLSIPAVKSRLHRARQQVRAELATLHAAAAGAPISGEVSAFAAA